MKKLSNVFLMLMMAVLCIVGCKSNEAEKKESAKAESKGSNDNKAPLAQIDDDIMLVAYLDCNSLVEKSGLTENQRKLLGSVVASDIEDATMRKYVMSIFSDIDNSGIKFSKPLYATMSFDDTSYTPEFKAVVVAEVSNVNTLDKFAESADAKFKREGDLRYATIKDENGDLTFGYNKNYFVAATAMNYNSYDLFKSTIDSAKMDLSIFEGKDIGLYLNCSELMAAINPALTNNEIVGELQGEDIKCLAGLSFEAGRIVVDAKYSGGNDKIMQIYKTLDNDNLKYVSGDAMAFANISLDGKRLVEIVKEVLTTERERELARELDMNYNGLVTTLQIIYEAVGSIDGAITLALNDVEVKTVYEDDYKVADTRLYVDAQLMANVSNTYIIENVPMLGNMVNKVGPNKYSIPLGRDGINIGQADNLLRVGIDAPCDNIPQTNMYDRWNSVFDNSIGYIVLDIENMANSTIGKQMIREIDYSDRRVVESIIKMLDCLYMNCKSTQSAELVLSFDDTKTNALEQIVTLILNTQN